MITEPFSRFSQFGSTNLRWEITISG